LKKRRLSRPIQIGNVTIGGGAPVVVQSMTKTDTRDVKSTINQIKELEDFGCELIRVAVPDEEAAKAIKKIKKNITIPLIADIHFDYRLAISSIRSGADAIRINPGNIRDKEQIRKIVIEAKQRQIPIRIGVNFGSLPPGKTRNQNYVQYMVKVTLDQIRLLESFDFYLIKLALKAFDVPTTVAAYSSIAKKTEYPLHLGITEAGLMPSGIIRSSVGIGILLHEGIGDTIRVSLTTHPREEVKAAYEILKSLNLRQYGPVVVSCPTCGRTETDIIELAGAIEKYLQNIRKPIKIAIMGCIVNGPGEARDADVGIACGKGRGAIFRKGRIIRSVDESQYFQAIIEEIHKV